MVSHPNVVKISVFPGADTVPLVLGDARGYQQGLFTCRAMVTRAGCELQSLLCSGEGDKVQAWPQPLQAGQLLGLQKVVVVVVVGAGVGGGKHTKLLRVQMKTALLSSL